MEIFDKLNINIESILDEPKINSYIKKYLNTLNTLNNDLKNILTNNN